MNVKQRRIREEVKELEPSLPHNAPYDNHARFEPEGPGKIIRPKDVRLRRLNGSGILHLMANPNMKG